MKGAVLILSVFIFSSSVFADNQAKPLMQCGPFTLSSSNDGFMHINDIRPVSQKFRFLAEQDDYKNVSYQWMVPRNDYPGFYGMDFIKLKGKAILNVEAIRSNMDQPRLFGTYDCVKVN
jgi:hypothetical protein